jgi:hypothetical protein
VYFSSSQCQKWVKSFALMAENFDGNAEKQGAFSSDIKLMPMTTSVLAAARSNATTQDTKTCHEE